MLNLIVEGGLINLSEDRKESRRANDELWDKKFADNEDRDLEGHLSRTEHRRQRSHNSMITTILILLIIGLAAAPLIYWINNKQSFNHPVRTEQVASDSSKNSKKKLPPVLMNHTNNPRLLAVKVAITQSPRQV